jgi:hypothetical protein
MVQTVILFDNVKVEHYRAVITIVDLISSIGGISTFLVEVFGVIFFPMTRFLVYLKSISKIYLVHST